MLLTDLNRVDINPVLEPPRALLDPHIIPAHLPLPHQPVLGKRPVLQPIRPPPLARPVPPLIPELDRDLSPPVSGSVPYLIQAPVWENKPCCL